MTLSTATPDSASARPLSDMAGRSHRRFPIGRILAWIIMILVIVVTLFPFWWALRTALSTQRDLLADPTSLMPVNFTLQNFQRVLGRVDTATAVQLGGSGQQLNFWLYLRNSFIYAGLIVVFQTFFCALAAYAFARLKFPGRDKIFFVYLMALMVPGIVTLIPNFILIRSLGWENTFMGIAAPTILMSPFAVFFLRQFFMGINRELDEAAMIDGAGLFTVFYRIIVPLAGPPLATLAILTFVTTWNTYLWPFLIGKDESVRVLTVGLAVFRSQTPQGAPDWTGLMAAALISIVPTVLIFVVLGRRVIDSIQFGGFK